MRLSEQMGLKWANIDWDSKMATVPLPKSRKTRRVPRSDGVLSILREQFSESPYVFPRAGDPLQPRGLKAVFRQLANS